MSTSHTFGSTDRYYAGTTESAAPPRGKQSTPYDAAFESVAKPLEEIVERVVSEFNVPVRDALRAETGLKLSFQGRQQSVRIRVVPGLPGPLDALARAQQDASIWAIYLHRALLETTRDGLGLLLSQWGLLLPPPQRSLPGYEEVPDTSAKDSVERSKELLEEILDRAKSVELEGKLKGLNEDVLGAYFFHRGEIQLYWMAIGLYAGILGRPVRELATITLIHELAHAYSHLGFDIDMGEWKTPEFANADLEIVEGLAQFYTEAVMDRVGLRSGSLTKTFNTLLAMQSKPYNVHRDWAKDARARGEIVRLGMLAARRHGIKDYDKFEDYLADGGGLLERAK